MSDPNNSSELFFEDFTGNSGQERLEWGVYHRNAGWQVAGEPLQSTGWANAFHGGSWTGDHDLSGGPPTTQRQLTSSLSDFNVDELVYTARDHMMTSMGDVDGYSVVWFSPDQTFDAVGEVTFDVNLTDLGNRQWIKVGVVSEDVYNSLGQGGVYDYNTAPGFVRSDVGASNLNGSLQDDGVLIASWSGGASAGYPGGLKIGNGDETNFSNPTPTDKMTRHTVSLKDNGDGTVTFTVAGASITQQGSFPDGPVRVVFYDHNYTPDKSESGTPIGHTWHWDNLRVLSAGEPLDATVSDQPTADEPAIVVNDDDSAAPVPVDAGDAQQPARDDVNDASNSDEASTPISGGEMSVPDDGAAPSDAGPDETASDEVGAGDSGPAVIGNGGAVVDDDDGGVSIPAPSEPSDVASALEALLTPSLNNPAVVSGSMADDLVVGSSLDDSMNGRWGNDRIDGQAGDDHIVGGHGDDVAFGGEGDDRLAGGFGRDLLVGGRGQDELRGNHGNDVLAGGEADDVLFGDAGDDVLYGGAGEDLINGGRGLDVGVFDGARGDYVLASIEGGLAISDASGATDFLSHVERVHFNGTGETYAVCSGQLVQIDDVDDLEALLDGELMAEVLNVSVGSVDAAAVDAELAEITEVDAGRLADRPAALGSFEVVATPPSGLDLDLGIDTPGDDDLRVA